MSDSPSLAIVPVSDVISLPTSDNNNLTTEKKVEEQFEEPGDIDDIQQDTPVVAFQTLLLEKLKIMTNDQRNQLIANISKNNKINVNNNVYSEISKNDIIRERVKQRREEMRTARLTKFSQTTIRENRAKRVEEWKKRHMTDNTNNVVQIQLPDDTETTGSKSPNTGSDTSDSGDENDKFYKEFRI